jgi:hypothetical protein
MDAFDAIQNKLIGGSSTSQPVRRKPNRKRGANSLANVPTAELEKRLERLKNSVTTRPAYDIGSSENMEALRQEKINKIEAELIKRKSDGAIPVVDNIASQKVASEASNVGNNMGFGALALGAIGFVVGGSLDKNPWGFAVSGAIIGALGAYGLTKYQQRVIKTKKSS